MKERSPKPSLTTAPVPAIEVERLAALYRYKILDTPPQAAFDRITTLAARLFDVLSKASQECGAPLITHNGFNLGTLCLFDWTS